MTADSTGEGLSAALIQLAEHAERIGSLDGREHGHHQDITARLGEVASSVASLTIRLGEIGSTLDRLTAWVENIYRPSYGRLAAMLPACWQHHPLCLFTLDWLSELWSVLYLSPTRNAAALAGQAEWQTRLLPAAAEQMSLDATRCQHTSATTRRLPQRRT